MRPYSSFINNVILPVYDIARSTKRVRYGSILNKTQWLPRDEVLKIQNKNLRELITHAYNTVPYYHRVFKERNLSPSDIKEVKDLIKLPILTKKDILKYKEELVSTKIPRSGLIPYMSGGTGDQITFYVTKDQLSWELAAEYRAYGWADYRLGDKCVLFWGSPIDLAKGEAFLRKFTTWLERVKIANTYILSDVEMKKHLDTIESFKPSVIKGYASSMYMVAKYLKDHNITSVKPRTALTSAEMLFPHYRSMIEDVFGCRVFDYYGSREIGAMAAECGEHRGFHINAENVAIEFMRDGEPVVEESGLVYVTNLRNYGMPFIRYEIGDVAKPSSEVCVCGRGLPLIETLEGRASQFMAVMDESGKIVPVSTAAPGIIGNLLMYVPVESYRVVQESLDRVVIQVVAGKSYSQLDTDFLVNHLNEYLKGKITVLIEKVEYLPPLKSGKRSVFISKINAFRKNEE